MQLLRAPHEQSKSECLQRLFTSGRLLLYVLQMMLSYYILFFFLLLPMTVSKQEWTETDKKQLSAVRFNNMWCFWKKSDHRLLCCDHCCPLLILPYLYTVLIKIFKSKIEANMKELYDYIRTKVHSSYFITETWSHIWICLIVSNGIKNFPCLQRCFSETTCTKPIIEAVGFL